MSESSNWHREAETADTGGNNDFELPDWHGMKPHISTVSKDQWRAYCKASLAKVMSRPGYEKLRREQNGIAVEFEM